MQEDRLFQALPFELPVTDRQNNRTRGSRRDAASFGASPKLNGTEYSRRISASRSSSPFDWAKNKYTKTWDKHIRDVVKATSKHWGTKYEIAFDQPLTSDDELAESRSWGKRVAPARSVDRIAARRRICPCVFSRGLPRAPGHPRKLVVRPGRRTHGWYCAIGET